MPVNSKDNRLEEVENINPVKGDNITDTDESLNLLEAVKKGLKLWRAFLAHKYQFGGVRRKI